MKGQISSLNAAVSAALLIFEVIRQRQLASRVATNIIWGRWSWHFTLIPL